MGILLILSTHYFNDIYEVFCFKVYLTYFFHCLLYLGLLNFFIYGNVILLYFIVNDYYFDDV
jgi:hypothetical protein